MTLPSTGGSPPSHRRGSRGYDRVLVAVYEDYARDSRVRRHVRALVAAGYRVDVFALGGAEAQTAAIGDGVRLHALGRRKYRGGSRLAYAAAYAAFSVRLAAGLLAARPGGRTLIWVNNPPDALVLAAIPTRPLRTTLVLDVHDMTSDLFAAKFRRCGLLGRMVRGTERLAYRLVDGIITVNESYVERLCAQVPGKPVAVVLNVPDFAHWIDIGDRRLETEVDASTDGLVVGHHGTIVERFGSDIAVRAVGLLRARGVTVRLRILGDGDFASGLERLIHAEGLDESIAFDRRAFRPEEVEEFSRSIDVGVAPYRPSIFIDRALPVKVLEYVALGVPVIATSTEPLRRHVDEGAILYLREASPEAVAEAITLMLDHDRRRAYATAGRATARRLAWSLERDKLMLWIERLADRRNRH